MNLVGTGYSESKVLRWSARIKPALLIPCGVLVGLVLGIIARAWMRWISTDPEFSWAGTIGILAGFVIFFTVHATVLLGRRKGWSRRWLTVARVVATILSLGIFSAAGASMLPTVLTASLGLARTDWPRFVRRVLIVLSVIIPVFLVRDIGADFGWNPVTGGRIILFVLIYHVIISVARITAAPQGDSWRMNRKVRATIWILLTCLVLLAAFNLQIE